MNYKHYTFSIIFGFTFFTQAATAQIVANEIEKQPVGETKKTSNPLPSVWKPEAELGFVKTTGNTDTESLNFKFAIENIRPDWEHTIKAESSRNSDKDVTTAERYFALLKTQYHFSERGYYFARIQYEDDRFSGFNYQASEVIGYGRKLIKNPVLELNMEFGVGVRQNDFEDGTNNTENIYLLAADMDWKISGSASLSEELSVETGDDRTISKSITALKTKINHSLSSKISYTIKRTSDVPVGTEKTDTELAVTLVYAFK